MGCNNGNTNTGNVNLFSGRENTGNVRMQGVEPGRWAGRGSLPCLVFPVASHQIIVENLPGLSSDVLNMGELCMSAFKAVSVNNTPPPQQE